MPMLAQTRPTVSRSLAILTTLALAAPVAAGDVLVVDPSGAGDHTTLQAAVNAASDGDVLLVRPGVYPEDVTLTARALTIAADGNVTLRGHLFVRDVAIGQVLLISGIDVAPPPGWASGPSYYGAVDVRDCQGRVRIQDGDLTGADSEGSSPFAHPAATFSGGPGLRAAQCDDIALIDCRATGGPGGLAVVAPSGLGGDGVWATDVALLGLIRTVSTGGHGGRGDDPGHGGQGARLDGATTLHIAYGAYTGGDAGCWETYPGSPGWTVDGGAGLWRGAGTTTWDFAGVFLGGRTAMQSGCENTPAGGNPGAPHGGPGGMTTQVGYPNTLHAPALVRAGQPWALDLVAEAGEQARLFHASQPTFDFSPLFEQPRLIGGVDVRRYPGVFTVPASQHVVVPFAPFVLPPSVDAYVHWFQGFVNPVGGSGAFSSARAIVYLNAGF